MPELGQPAALERLLFWARTAGIVFLLLGVVSTFSAGWLSARLDALRKADLSRLEEKVQQLESTPKPAPAAEAAPKQATDAGLESTSIDTPSPPSTRQITAEQHEQLVATLRSLAETKVTVLTLQDWDSAIYAHQVAKTLRAAGLNVRVLYMEKARLLDRGLTCYWAKDQEEAGTRIINALRSAGVDLTAYSGMPMGGSALEIHIAKVVQEATRAREVAK